MNRLTAALLALFLLTVIAIVAVGTDTPQTTLTANASTVLWAGLAAFLALRNYRMGEKSARNTLWLLISLGMLCWFIGEVGWAVYEIGLDVEVPYPSIPDVFWALGYLPLIGALVALMAEYGKAVKEKFYKYFGVIAIVAALIVGPMLVLPMLAGESSIAALAISIFYVLADIVLLALSIGISTLMGEVFSYDLLSRSWRWFAGGIFALALFDLSFSWVEMKDLYFTPQGNFFTGPLLLIVYITAYFALAMAFAMHKEAVQ
jgi:hypothetical protein